MTSVAPWLALSVDWDESAMFDEAPASTRLAWVCLLCHVKAQGRAGRAKMRPKTFATRYRLSDRAVEDMLQRAQKCAAIELADDVVTICNWRVYQDKSHRRHEPECGPFPHLRELRDLREKPATPHPPPSTKHQAPTSPPTPHVGPNGEAGRLGDEFGKEWGSVISGLTQLGIVRWREGLTAARSAGCDHRHVMALLNHATAKQFGPGAVYRRLMAAAAGMPIEAGWPETPVPQKPAASVNGNWDAKVAADVKQREARVIIKRMQGEGATDEAIEAALSEKGLRWG